MPVTVPILTTKLYLPPTRPSLVPRPRLIEQLNAGLHCNLTLISAPAGFGKTTLLSDWSQQVSQPVAWLSLDEEDNHLARFLAYFISAIQSIGVDLNIEPESILQSTQLPETKTILTTIINDINAAQTSFMLVLDDFHVMETPAIHQAVSFLLVHLPPQMHLVIATRSDPIIPLSRLRGRGQINELRVDDLRFRNEEAGVFIYQVIGIDISADQIATLNTRTEGWIAGLQMAAISMRDEDDIPGFISSFAGDHRYIVDYLVDEVLTQCSQTTRDFLLQTSILEHMSAPLCDAITGQSGSQTTLEKLEQDNLFTIPLDQRREWYRYHHLFVELLRHRLRQTYPDLLETLHTRASIWWEDNGSSNLAIKHALTKEDKHLAADLIERHAKIQLYQSQIQTMLEWIDPLPEEIIQERPMVCIYHAWALVFDDPNNNHDKIELRLVQAQQALNKADTNGILENIIAGHTASVRALLSQPPVLADHDPYVVLDFLHEAQSLLPPSEVEVRGINNVNIGYEYLHLADTQAALEVNKSAFTEGQAGENHIVVVVSICSQALIAYYQGKLAEAIDICQNGITSFDRFLTDRSQAFPILGILPITLGYMLVERGEMEAAESELTRGLDLLQWVGEYEVLSWGHIALTRLLLLKGEYEQARQLVKRLKGQWPACAPLADTLQIQTKLSRHDIDSAAMENILSWERENRLELGPEADIPGITPWAETQHLAHLTWIQAQIAHIRQEPDSTDKSVLQVSLDYLNRRLITAQERGLVFRMIECSVIKTLVLDTLGEAAQALETLSPAITLAESEGFRRVFLDKGPPMARLLREVAKQDQSIEFILDLLEKFGQQKGATSQPPSQELVESLTERELEVLQLLSQGLSNREIGEQLFLALDTVKGHNRNIYGKLGVKNRTQAINKAISLKVISPL
jgi:LuxR family maltose regulon positive regulatory protein